jgi:putative alpha-1,2-mannosidase
MDAENIVGRRIFGVRMYYPGQQFEAKSNSPENVYIQSATLNRKALDKSWIYHNDVVKDATLVLVMRAELNTHWRSGPDAGPPQNEA